ncbi:unnamed protein product, partial [Prorocentrum cordatum]
RHRSFFAAQRARLLRAGRALPRPSREGSMSLTRVGETSGGSRSGSRNSTPRAQRKGDAGGASNTVRRSAGTGGGGGQGG